MSELLQVRANYQLGTIEENLEEVAQAVSAYCDEYKGLVVREEDVPDTKKLLADIRKEREALDTQRKTIKKAWNKPYDAFEKKVKDVLGIYDETIDAINGQLKVFEDARKEAKKAVIKNIYESVVPEEIAPYIPLERIYNAKWENTTCTPDKIEGDIEIEKGLAIVNVNSIKGLQSKWEDDALKVLRDGGNLVQAIAKMREMEAQEAKIKAEIQPKEEEPKAEKKPCDDLPFGLAGTNSYTMVFRATRKDYQRMTDFLESTSIEYTIYEED